MNPADAPRSQEPTENTLEDFQSNTNDNENPSMPLTETAPPRKKGPLLKIVMIILGTIIAIPFMFLSIIMIGLFAFSTGHDIERNKLEKETANLFQNSSVNATDYDCHDVELRNQCYFTISTPPSIVASYLEQQGFSKNDTYGDGYRRGELYIVIDGVNNHYYTSYYISE